MVVVVVLMEVVVEARGVLLAVTRAPSLPGVPAGHSTAEVIVRVQMMSTCERTWMCKPV